MVLGGNVLGGCGGGGILELIEDIELAIAAAAFDFQNIPADYDTLVLFSSLRDALADPAQSVYMTLNGDNGNNYYSLHRTTWAGGSNASEVRAGTAIQAATAPGNNAPANCFSSYRHYFYDYRDIANYKAVNGQGGHMRATSAGGIRATYLYAQWMSAAVINQITLVTNSGSNFMAGSRCTLYGIPA